MIDTVPRPDAGLTEFLAARARHASDAALAAFAAGGFITLAAFSLWHGPAWLFLASVGACAMSFGVWGIADRELGEHPDNRPRILAALRTVRWAAVAVGALGAAGAALSFLGIALGPIIS